MQLINKILMKIQFKQDLIYFTNITTSSFLLLPNYKSLMHEHKLYNL